MRETENELKKIINFAKLNTFSYSIIFNFIKSQIASLCQTPIHNYQYQFTADGRKRTKMGDGVRGGRGVLQADSPNELAVHNVPIIN